MLSEEKGIVWSLLNFINSSNPSTDDKRFTEATILLALNTASCYLHFKLYRKCEMWDVCCVCVQRSLFRKINQLKMMCEWVCRFGLKVNGICSFRFCLSLSLSFCYFHSPSSVCTEELKSIWWKNKIYSKSDFRRHSSHRSFLAPTFSPSFETEQTSFFTSFFSSAKKK